MDTKNLSKKAMKICVEDSLQKVMDILEQDDGRPFEDKKNEAIEYLKNQEEKILAERVLTAAIKDETGRCLKEKFWAFGKIEKSNSSINLREVREVDKEKFIELQKETSIIKGMLKEESYQMMLWNEHIQDKSLIFTIEVDGEYAGYCGINDLSKDNWEIAIELLTEWRYRGIGFVSIGTMLSEIKTRLDVNEFRVKVDGNNYASQRLFEKLGATPYGIAELILHKEEDIFRFEEENLDAIDENIIALAEKFGVEPRKLLSHVLEYKLVW